MRRLTTSRRLDWSRLDDYRFVRLVGDLLTKFGFVHVDYQGIGPDGGIDLFATELVPFVARGRVPFRWAIQCKFSSKGDKASVRETEVHDVEAILRSDRFRSQGLRGYMLISNRQIAQNVVERLRGIDASSSFRTATIDSAELNRLLAENPDIADRHFFSHRLFGRSLKTPYLIVPGSESFRFPLEINASRSSKGVLVNAILDTGFSGFALIPEGVAATLKLKYGAKTTIQLADHSVRSAWLAPSLLRPKGAREFVEGTVLVDAGVSETLVGADFIRGFTTVIDPDGTLTLYDIEQRERTRKLARKHLLS